MINVTLMTYLVCKIHDQGGSQEPAHLGEDLVPLPDANNPCGFIVILIGIGCTDTSLSDVHAVPIECL